MELELQIIDPQTRHLAPAASQIIANIPKGVKAKNELVESNIEVITNVCEDVEAVQRDLEWQLDKLFKVTDQMGLAVMGGGTHPTDCWEDQKLSPQERYHALLERIQFPMRRLLIFGLHVHVGVPSAEHAIAVNNALACYIPHFLAISASSPYWEGEDSGMASVRTKVFESMPTAGLPYHLDNWNEFLRFMRTLIGAGTIESVREIWWDIRPHPGFGTIELRMCDGVGTLQEVLAITALVQSLVAMLCSRYTEGEEMPFLKQWIIRENKWRGCRWGRDANIIINDRGDQQPVQQNLKKVLEQCLPFAEKLGCKAELELIDQLMTAYAPGYIRQRHAFQKNNSFDDVIDQMIHEFRTNTITAV
ncbi:MAG: glutamate--cysteine ligase [Gemmatimonadetes bacterium]|nr:MAG: glutamate--cysteine ligase [Gemmatimonadota bacterium]